MKRVTFNTQIPVRPLVVKPLRPIPIGVLMNTVLSSRGVTEQEWGWIDENNDHWVDENGDVFAD